MTKPTYYSDRVRNARKAIPKAERDALNAAAELIAEELGITRREIAYLSMQRTGNYPPTVPVELRAKQEIVEGICAVDRRSSNDDEIPF